MTLDELILALQKQQKVYGFNPTLIRVFGQQVEVISVESGTLNVVLVPSKMLNDGDPYIQPNPETPISEADEF